MDKYKVAYLKETMGLICQACNTMVTRCDKWKKNTQWIFNPAENTFFTSGCLGEIKRKLDLLNAKTYSENNTYC